MTDITSVKVAKLLWHLGNVFSRGKNLELEVFAFFSGNPFTDSVLTGIRRYGGSGDPYIQTFSGPMNDIFTDIGPFASDNSVMPYDHCVVYSPASEAFYDAPCSAWTYDAICEIQQLS